MSAGTPVRPVRIDTQTWCAVAFAVSSRNSHSAEEPWTMSTFIQIAVREKLAKMKRCRRSRRARHLPVAIQDGEDTEDTLNLADLVDTDGATA